jgi:hypothetical protein
MVSGSAPNEFMAGGCVLGVTVIPAKSQLNHSHQQTQPQAEVEANELISLCFTSHDNLNTQRV